MNLKPHKKQFLLKDTFGEGLLNYIDKEEYKPKIRRYRRYNTEIDNHIQNIDIDISRRVINPEYNKEISSLFKKGKRSLSQAINFYHRTNGNLSSLFNLTPINIENKTKKKLFKNKSFAAPTINIFSDNFSKQEKPTHTKKLFIDNNCQFDTIKDENLVAKINNCWKKEKRRRNKSFDNTCLSKKDFSLKYDLNTLNLRNIKYEYSLNDWNNNRNLGKIKRKQYL